MKAIDELVKSFAELDTEN